MPEEPRVPPEYWDEIGQLYASLVESLREAAARQLGSDSGLAHDIVQDAFQDAALCWAQLRLRGPGAREAWLRTVVRNKIYNRWRASGRRSRLVGDAERIDHEPSQQNTALQALDRIEVENCIKVIDAMPEMRRRVAFLRWKDQWSTPEIADHLGIAVSTVRAHIHAARRDLGALRPGADQDDELGGGRQ